MKSFKRIKAILLCFLMLGLVKTASAEHMNITLKDNTFNITSLCSTPSQPSGRGDYKCERKYVIELVSKYNVFENYKFAYRAVTLQTPLYDIDPETDAPNRSKLNIFLTEKDLEKIFESGKVKVNFELMLFSEKLLKKEVDNLIERDCYGKSGFELSSCRLSGGLSYNINNLEPSLTLNFNNTSIDRLKSSCSVEHKQCQKELDTLNTPTNRLKRFFSGN